MPLSKSTSPVEMFDNENYLDGLQDMRFKITIINFIKDFKKVKKDQKKQLSKIKEKEHKENKHMGHSQNNTNIRLMEIPKATKTSEWKSIRREKH